MTNFSFIIPVYNAEKTLKRCLDSILGQTFHEYEVLLIDDGSTDKSNVICEKYCLMNPRFLLIIQENGGPSAARNKGINIAKGNYICFVDSDDYIESDYLEKLNQEILKEHPDCIFFGYYKEVNEKKPEIILPEAELDSKENLCLELSKHDLFGYTWVKCFSLQVIGTNRFDETLNLLEDEVFTLNVIKRCKTISTLPLSLYHYVIGDNDTLTKKTHPDYCKKMDKVYQAWIELLDSSIFQDELNHKANSFTSMCRYYGMEHEVEIQDYFDQLKNTHFFKDHTNDNEMDELIRNKQYRKLKLRKSQYRLKQSLSKMLHGK